MLELLLISKCLLCFCKPPCLFVSPRIMWWCETCLRQPLDPLRRISLNPQWCYPTVTDKLQVSVEVFSASCNIWGWNRQVGSLETNSASWKWSSAYSCGSFSWHFLCILAWAVSFLGSVITQHFGCVIGEHPAQQSSALRLSWCGAISTLNTGWKFKPNQLLCIYQPHHFKRVKGQLSWLWLNSIYIHITPYASS